MLNSKTDQFYKTEETRLGISQFELFCHLDMFDTMETGNLSMVLYVTFIGCEWIISALMHSRTC